MPSKRSFERLSAGALARLLDRLGPDNERAAAAYEALQQALVRFFDWRGALSPEECVDETLDRLARKLDEGNPVDDIRSFALGIARLVLLEYWRRPEARMVPADEAGLEDVAAPEPMEDSPRHACLERCLKELPPEARDLVLQYYVSEGRSKIDNRRRLAVAHGLSDNALRSRVQRVRDRLERCIAKCLNTKSR